MLDTCVFTVSSPIESSLAISLLERPRASALSTSTSRGDNGSTSSRPRPRRISSSTLAATLGSSRLSPRAAARTDSATTSTPAVFNTYESAPALIASNSSSSPWWEVRMITCVDGLISFDRSQSCQAVHLRHQQIEQHHRRDVLAHQRDRLLSVRRLTDDVDVGFVLQQKSQSLAHHLVVVDDEKPDHEVSTGSFAETVVPPPSRVSIVSVPPSSSTRSRINRSPRP